MKTNSLRSYAFGLAVALFAIPGLVTMHASAQSSTAQSNTELSNTELSSANAVLTHSLDSKHATSGQNVTAKLTSDATSQLQKGTVLIGKIDQSQNVSTAGTSKMSITFDQARLKNGQEIPIKAMLLGAYSPQVQSNSGMSTDFLPIQPNTVPETKTVTQEPGALKHNVGMQSSGESDTSAVFTSTGNNIQLDKGTILQVAVARMPASGVNATTSTTGAMQ